MKGFAPINNDLSYWQKQTKPLFPDLAWTIPEQKTSTITVIGGNAQSFVNVARTAEIFTKDFPIKRVLTLLPDVLKHKLPYVENILFTPSTNSGSFAKSALLNEYFDNSDFNFIAGDTSRNAETAIALIDAAKSSTKPLTITRDAVDLMATGIEPILEQPHLYIVASMLQLQKIFRAVYYPRMILLSQPLIPVLETLHKFTLTYPVTLTTFHQDNIIVAKDGKISTTHIADTNYTPLALWSGSLAAKITALNLFNPNRPYEATTAAILYK